MVKANITGHGFDNNQSTAEFRPFRYNLKINMSVFTQALLLTKCVTNSIYLQGTRIYDRAGWCPGAKGDYRDIVITNAVRSDNNTIKF